MLNSLSENEVVALAADLAGGAEVIDARERFDRLLESRRREELFLLDGHLSDTGYAEIADLVAERLREGK